MNQAEELSEAQRPHPEPRVEFLLCGEPRDAFLSQIAFFRLSIDAPGAFGREARVVAVLGGESGSGVPPEWQPYFERIEVHLASPEAFRRERFHAACDMRFELLDPDADVSCICDADTALLRPLPGSFLEAQLREPKVSGVIAHYPFPVTREVPGNSSDPGLRPRMPAALAWEVVAKRVVGRTIPREHRYSLLEETSEERCPFYVNYGFLAAPPALMLRMYRALRELQPSVADLLDNAFAGQVALALAIAEGGLPHLALPMRYNFPNDPDADRLHPRELEEATVIHYLRTGLYDRHRILADENGFDRFLSLEDLTGSDLVFQNHVAAVTKGRYPFSR